MVKTRLGLVFVQNWISIVQSSLYASTDGSNYKNLIIFQSAIRKPNKDQYKKTYWKSRLKIKKRAVSKIRKKFKPQRSVN